MIGRSVGVASNYIVESMMGPWVGLRKLTIKWFSCNGTTYPGVYSRNTRPGATHRMMAGPMEIVKGNLNVNPDKNNPKCVGEPVSVERNDPILINLIIHSLAF